MLPGVSTHPYSILRPGNGTDEEGNPTASTTLVGAGRGHLEVLSTAARVRAANAGQESDAAIETRVLPAGTRIGDILDCRGARWQIVAINPFRAPVRVLVQVMS